MPNQAAKRAEIRKLPTEKSNRASAGLDRKSALEIARIINAEDQKVAGAMAKALPRVAKAIDAVAEAIASGGRLIYVGAGTSGRIAALDASEVPPTFNISYEVVQFVMAGGVTALYSAFEANEDSRDLGKRDIAERNPGPKDVVCGIAASGRTPYTVAAVEYARSRGAKTIGVACAKDSELGRAAHIAIEVEVGPEVVTGSTRMKAGTAQKFICNMLTTGAMARLGYVYDNLMVNVIPTNQKLEQRAIGIISAVTGQSDAASAKLLRRSGDSVPLALIMGKSGVTRSVAEQRLKEANGNLRRALSARRGV
jgi:N-acetylmuramic acid 6-phosphate etherase